MHFENIEKFTIKIQSLEKLIEPNILISFNQLKELTIQARDCYLEDCVIDFIKRNPFIKKITFENYESFSENWLHICDIVHRELVPALATVEEVYFDDQILRADQILELVSKCKSLRIFTCKIRHSTNPGYDLLREQLSTEWRIFFYFADDGRRMIKLEH